MAIDNLNSRSKVAFITGITGQDGSYLSELLLEKNYQVHGLIRPTSQRRQALNRPIRPGVTLHFGDLSDVGRLIQILSSIKPDEIYHLAAQSHVGVSFETPISTSDSNALGTLRLLEAMRILQMGNSTRFYNASSAELYGSEMPAPQTEETPFHPVSPYAISKQFQFWTTVNFREAYDFHASNGILFNHESPRRGITFVTRKITSQVAMIACGQTESFELGNLNALRDWGHAKDYMHGVYLMLQQPKSGDYVLASGQAYSVRQFVEAAFRVIGVDIKWSGEGIDEVGYDSTTSKVRVRVNSKFYRPLENENLLGSPEKAKRVLGWEPKYDFQGLVKEMIMSDIEAVQNGKIFANTHLDWLVEESNGIETNGSSNHKTNENGVTGRQTNDHELNGHASHSHVPDDGKGFTVESHLVRDKNDQAPTKISCRWRFSKSNANPYALRHFHCLDLLMKVEPSQSDAESQKKGQNESYSDSAETAVEDLVHACRKSHYSAGQAETAFKVLLVPRNGYLCREDILRLRMQDSEIVDSLVNFEAPDGFFPAISHNDKSLLSLLPSSPGALLLKPSQTSCDMTFDSLEQELDLRLTFDWILPKKPAERRIALVGGRYKYDMEDDSFGHKGTFDAAQALGIAVVVLDRPGHWLQDDRYCHLREDFIPIDLTDDVGLPLRIVQALQGRQIDGITTLSDEVVIPTARAAEIMQLPTESAQSILQAHNKFEARKLLSPNIQALQLHNIDQLDDSSFAEKLQAFQYPVIIKPRMGGGSRGVKKANDYHSAQQVIRQLHRDGFAGRGILIETYIEGPEVDANFVLWDGEILFFEVIDDLPCDGDASDATISDTFIENVLLLPSSLDSHEIHTIRSDLHQGLLQLGLRSGVFHVEARIRNSSKHYAERDGFVDLVDTDAAAKHRPEVVLIEVNVRPPGLMAVFATMFTHGVDYGALMLLRALGDRERFTVLSKPFACHYQYWTGLILIPIPRKDIAVPGKFCKKVIERVPDIAPHVSRAEPLATAKVVSPVGGTGFLGYFLVFSRTSRQHALKMSSRIQEAARGLLDSR